MVDIIKKIQESNLPVGAKLFSISNGEVEYRGIRTGNGESYTTPFIYCKTRFNEGKLFDKFGRVVNFETYEANDNAICDLYPLKLDEEYLTYSDRMWEELPELSIDMLERLKKISEPAPSDWREHAKWRQENRYWTRYSGLIALYLLIQHEGLGAHEYIKEKLDCDDSTVRKICKGDYDFKMSEILKLVTPEEFANIMSVGYEYFKNNSNSN